jgi:threonine aldolase
MPRYDFASDNTAGAAPEALAALCAHNNGFAAGYGADPVTAKAANALRDLLDADCEVRFVPSGTGANAVACASLCRPFEAVVAHEHAHICTDETGAPGFFGHGLGLIGLPGAHGRIGVDALDAALDEPDVSYRQSPAALSLTNATEYGTLYSNAEIEQLAQAAKAKGLGVHLDGARLANAAAAGFDLKAIARSGVDILVFGGTKAGMPPTEAICLFDPAIARRFDARLKQGGQLPSKGRFYAAPFLGMLEGGALLRHAAHANRVARALAAASPFRVTHPVEANGVFVEMDEPTRLRLVEKGWFAYRFLDGSVRFMCSWATTEAAVEELAETLQTLV